jgi:hypothetical protein
MQANKLSRCGIVGRSRGRGSLARAGSGRELRYVGLLFSESQRSSTWPRGGERGRAFDRTPHRTSWANRFGWPSHNPRSTFPDPRETLAAVRVRFEMGESAVRTGRPPRYCAPTNRTILAGSDLDQSLLGERLARLLWSVQHFFGLTVASRRCDQFRERA